MKLLRIESPETQEQEVLDEYERVMKKLKEKLDKKLQVNQNTTRSTVFP